MTDYNYKIEKHLFPLIKNFQKPNILEFGVQNGRSTKRFLEICRKKKGHLTSIDITDCSKLFIDKNWTFIQSRDDDFEYLEKRIPKKFDVIFLDSLHEANHVEKIFYYYYPKLNVDGYFFIDDISPIPYLKDKRRNSFYCEINNRETNKRILEIFNNNTDLFDLNFSYISSGLAIIKKNKKSNLKKKKSILSREFTVKNFFRNTWKLIKKN
jgi:predicted O-methyltransferase YrrM